MKTCCLTLITFQQPNSIYLIAYRFEPDKDMDELKVELFKIRENKQSVLERFRV